MKKLLAIAAIVLLTASCATAPEESAQPTPTASESVAPTPIVADNRVPKTCELPLLTELATELAGQPVITEPNPVNRQNSNEQNYQAYLDGLYMVCIYQAKEAGKAAYIFFRQTDPAQWQAAMAAANDDLETGEAPFEPVSLGLGETGAYYVIESEENGGFFNAQVLVEDISIVVFTNLAPDLTTGTRFIEAAIASMP